jgi:hypothetical protein
MELSCDGNLSMGEHRRCHTSNTNTNIWMPALRYATTTTIII